MLEREVVEQDRVRWSVDAYKGTEIVGGQGKGLK